MHFKRRLIWEIYLLVAIAFAVGDLSLLLSPQSPNALYFSILRAFDPIYSLQYSAYVIHVFLELIHCVPLFLFIHQIRLFTPKLWKYLFILRCVFEFFGRSYEWNIVIAFYKTNPKLLFLLAPIVILPHIPSYVACYLYAFRANTWKST